MADDDYCYLTTTGRRSGRPHEIEIWYAVAPDESRTLYLLAGSREQSDWVRNLTAESTCSVRIGRRDAPARSARARVIGAGEPEEAVARTLVFEKFQARYDGDLSDWRDAALPVALDLDPDPDAN